MKSLNSESEIMFRFAFHSDIGNSEEGAVVDDLVIEGILPQKDVQFTDDFQIFPNPSEGIFNIKWESKGRDMKLTLYDITGKTILSKTAIKKDNFNIDLHNFSSGIYFLTLKTTNKIVTKKLVVN